MNKHDFVRQPLERKYNRRNIMDRLDKLETGAHSARPSARVTNLSELSRQFTAGRFIAVGDDGTIRVVMSGTELLDMGVAAHLAGFDNTGTPQFWVDADDGAIRAGGGDVSVDSEGVWIENQQAALGFEDTNGDRFKIYLASGGSDALHLINQTGAGGTAGAGGVILFVDTTTHDVLNLMFSEDPSNAEGGRLYMQTVSGEALFALSNGVAIWAGKDGTETVFNNDSKDVDFRIESAAHTSAFQVDAGLESIVFFGGDLAVFDNGTAKRLEIGNDHYIPTRSASNPNVYFNEANQDMDFQVEGTTDSNLLKIDAGINAVGIGGAPSTDYKLKVTGNFYADNVTSGTYTPTLTDVANLDSSTTNGDLIYTRIGNIVSVWGSVIVNPTAAGGTVTRLGISLPIASNFTDSAQLAGTGNDRVNSQIANYNGDTTNDRCEMVFPSLVTGNATFRFTFAYPVL